MPQISVVIPVRNNAFDLPAAVASALAQPHIHELLLCIGPSGDGSLGVAQTLADGDARVKVLENAHGGIPQALNLGLASLKGDVLMRLDAHSVLPPDYVVNALDTVRMTGAANVGAVQHPVGQTLVERGIAVAMRSRVGSGGADYRGAGERKRVDTAFLGFFNAETLHEVGGWDEEFARNEDAELNLRLAQAGHEVWLDPRLVVDYRPRPSIRALASQYFHYGTWRLRTIRKHPGSARVRQMVPPAVVLALLVSAAVLPFTIWAVSVPAGYFGAMVIAGLASEGSVGQRLTTSCALATMHLSWGSGFLLSAMRSVLPGVQRGST